MLRVISGRRKFVNKALRSCIIHGESHEKNVGCKQGLANIHSNIHELLHVCISTVHKCSGAVRTTELCGNTRSSCYARISFCSLYGVYRHTFICIYACAKYPCNNEHFQNKKRKIQFKCCLHGMDMQLFRTIRMTVRAHGEPI